MKTEVKDVPNSYITSMMITEMSPMSFTARSLKNQKYYLNEIATGNSSSDNTSATESIKDTNTNIDSEQTVLYNKYIKQNVKSTEQV